MTHAIRFVRRLGYWVADIYDANDCLVACTLPRANPVLTRDQSRLLREVLSQ